MLSPAGYEVRRAFTAEQGFARARSQPPDIAFVNLVLPNGSAIDLCRHLRDQPWFGSRTPVLVLVAGSLDRRRRLEVLAAGAWDVVTLPADARELLARVDNYTQAKLEGDALQAESLLDPKTDLYNRRGLERRARELRTLADRSNQSLACVVLTAVGPRGTPADEPSLVDLARRVAAALASAVRASDAVGRWDEGAGFAVLAPNTNSQGVERLAHRAVAAATAALPDASRTVRLQAAWESVTNVHDSPREAADLLERTWAKLAVE